MNYATLPNGYRYAGTLDFMRNRRQMKAMLILSLALIVVQQLDGSWISPRIMGSLTGFSPATVLVGIFAGARLGGVVGMLLALPVMMSLRTVFRIFVQKYENI